MKQLLALLGAAVLVVGAFVLRRDVIEGGDDTGGGDTDTELTVVCSLSLGDVCDELATAEPEVIVVEEEESATMARIAAGELRLDADTAWLAVGPWPPVATATAEGAGEELPALAGSASLARSPAVIVGRADRLEAVATTCGTVDWACIGDRAGAPWTDLGGQPQWGRVEVGMASPSGGAGLVALTQAVASKVGRSDFATNDLDEDPATAAWFDRLASAAKSNDPGSATPLRRFLQLPGSLGVVGALEAETEGLAGRQVGGAELAVVIPEPVATAEVRLWSGDADAVADATDRLDDKRLTDLMVRSGWRAPEPADAPGAGTMDSADPGPWPEDGLPSAGTMSAVVTRWEDVR